MATEVTKSVRIVSDLTGERLNPNQAATVKITVGQRVYVLDAEKGSEHVAALIAAAPVEQKKRGRKKGSSNATPEAAGSPETDEQGETGEETGETDDAS